MTAQHRTDQPLGRALLSLIAALVIVFLYQTGGFNTADQLAFAAVEPLRQEWLTPVMVMITHLGGVEGLLPIGAILVIGAFLKGYRLEAGVLLVTLLGGDLVSDWLKDLYQRPRPPLPHLVTTPESSAMPSGHAFVGTAFYLMLAYLLGRHFFRIAGVKRLVPWLCLLIVLIGFSRVYLGVHYLSDVLAGAAFGASWYYLVRFAYERYLARWRPQKRPGDLPLP